MGADPWRTHASSKDGASKPPHPPLLFLFCPLSLSVFIFLVWVPCSLFPPFSLCSSPSKFCGNVFNVPLTLSKRRPRTFPKKNLYFKSRDFRIKNVFFSTRPSVKKTAVFGFSPPPPSRRPELRMMHGGAGGGERPAVDGGGCLHPALFSDTKGKGRGGG